MWKFQESKCMEYCKLVSSTTLSYEIQLEWRRGQYLQNIFGVNNFIGVE